ncbi:MAG: penicillin-binding protein 2 [Treponema sp.]|jgi:penicillin-binding protein 2|nr:penicillin-binding protein 2 [Treponema sp.]
MNDVHESRINIFRFFFIFIIIIFSVRLFSMQILSGEVYLTRAQDISRRTYTIPTQRGEILDRNMTTTFVNNRDSFAVSITPAEVPRNSMDGVIQTVSEILGVSSETIRARLPSQYLQLYQPVEIAVNVPFSVISALAERKNVLPGVSWQSKYLRNYNNVGSLSHVLGYVGDITRDELTTLYNLGYQQGDIVGKSGIERQYDDILRGKQGWETKTVDSRGRRIADRRNVTVPPEMGKNLVLTIDAELQTLVEKALGQRIGSVVVIKPSTGEILAMVSYPWYDPNIFTDGLPSDYRALAEDPHKPFINRAIQSSYPPASAFKIVMSTAIYGENAFPPEQTILCRGFINYGGRDWHCHNRNPGHGRLNLRRALPQSCNIFYYTTGRDNLGAETIVSYSKDYGFGEATGIDLPGEIAGFIPTPQWKERRYHERWVLGDTMNMSIGQGYTLVTPVQMANMVCMIVNDGKIYKPFLLKEVRDPGTNAIEIITKPEIMHQSSIEPHVFESVRNDMRAVITEGTAQYPLNLRSVQIAGKTGTGQVGLLDGNHSWFVAYAPYNNTDIDEVIVVSIIVEAVNQWEWWSPYASAVIFQGYFANQNYETAVRALGLQYLMPVTPTSPQSEGSRYTGTVNDY